jgi:hypothetical protein
VVTAHALCGELANPAEDRLAAYLRPFGNALSAGLLPALRDWASGGVRGQ